MEDEMRARDRKDLLHKQLMDAIESIALAAGDNALAVGERVSSKIASGLLDMPIFDELVARRLEAYARDPMFVRDIAETVANTNLDTLHLEDANVAYAAAADTLAAVVEALKEEARKR